MIADTPEKRQERPTGLSTLPIPTIPSPLTLTLKGLPAMDTSSFQRWIMNGPLEHNTSVRTIDFFEDEGRAVLAFGSQGARDEALFQARDWIAKIPNRTTGITALAGTVGALRGMMEPVVEKLNIPGLRDTGREIERETENTTLLTHTSNIARAQERAASGEGAGAGIARPPESEKEREREKEEKEKEKETKEKEMKEVERARWWRRMWDEGTAEGEDMPFIVTLAVILLVGVVATVAW